jgi:hypothetical protein
MARPPTRLQAMPDFSTLVRPFPTSALLTGAGDIEGLLPRLHRVRERVKAGRTPGVATGVPSFDKHLGGLQTGVTCRTRPCAIRPAKHFRASSATCDRRRRRARVPPVNRPFVCSTPPASPRMLVGMIDVLLKIGPDTLVLAAMASTAFGLWLGCR